MRNHKTFLRLLLSFLIGTLAFSAAGQMNEGIAAPPAKHLTIFLLDGLSWEALNQELAIGALPNIKQMIDSGTYIPNGVTAFPSVSGYAHYPFVTGVSATESGIFGLRWFDRTRDQGNFRNYVGRTNHHIDHDIAPEIPTFFEQFSDSRTSTFNSFVSRGATLSRVFGADFVVSKFKDRSVFVGGINVLTQLFNLIPKFGLSNDIATNSTDLDTKIVTESIEGLGKKDKVQFVVFPSLDNMNHLEGYKENGSVKPKYFQHLRHIDSLIGKYREESRRQGTEEDRLYLLTSDHGINVVNKNLNIVKELSDRFGLSYDRDSASRKKKSLAKPLSDYVSQEIDVVQALQGNNMCYLYFKDPFVQNSAAAWRSPLLYNDLINFKTPGDGPKINMVETVATMEGVEFVMYKSSDPSVYLITSRHGTSQIFDTQDESFGYKLVSGVDPLGYPEADQGIRLSDEDWLKLTYDREYPHAVPLIARLLRHHKDVDLVVTAQKGYDHGLDYENFVGNYRGGHGGLDKEQIRIPFVLTGPGIKKGLQIPTARSEDIGKTIQLLMGKPVVGSSRTVEAALELPQ